MQFFIVFILLDEFEIYINKINQFNEKKTAFRFLLLSLIMSIQPAIQILAVCHQTYGKTEFYCVGQTCI